MKRLVAGSLAMTFALSLAACATPYGPAGYGARPPGGVAETRITDDRYRVSFQGRADPGYAFDQALVRAAHLTLRDGRDWFVVEDRYTEAERGYNTGPTISLGGSNFSFGRRSGSSIGAGIGFQLGGGGAPRPSTSLQIRTGAGELRPEGAFDARDVIATIGPRL